MECYHLMANGICNGRYNGFACIGPKCKAEKDPPCEHYDLGFYCKKYRRFGCVGISKCREDLNECVRVPHTRGDEPVKT